MFSKIKKLITKVFRKKPSGQVEEVEGFKKAYGK